MTLLTVFTLLLAAIQLSVSVKLEERFHWTEVAFAWPSEDAKIEAIRSGRYIPYNNLPLGLEQWNDKIFLTIPRWKTGVAASLVYFNLSEALETTKSPVLTPYPSWAEHELVEGELKEDKAANLRTKGTIISVFRIRADECDRLWVMDTGLVDIFGEAAQHYPPSLLIFDLKTDLLLHRYTFKDSDIKEDTFFANVIVDTSADSCEDAFAYVPDLGAYAVVVYSLRENNSWRVKHNFFHFDPLSGDYNVDGINFQWTDGVFGMALDRRESDGSRKVYFHAFSSTKEFVVSNKVLQNETYSTSSDCYFDFKLLGDRGLNSQATAEVFDEDSQVLFYTQPNKDAIGCWNSNKDFTPDNQGLVDSDSDALVFPNDIKLDVNGTLWVLSDRLPRFIYDKLDETQFNYRILTGHVDELIKGTPCDRIPSMAD